MINYFLIGIGLFLVIISFLLSEKKDGKNKNGNSEGNSISIWTEKDEKNVRERIADILTEKVEEAMVKSDDYLAQISNEKIMAVNEFSDQILEKINHNHSEVIFLFDMLNEKEIDIKELIKTIEVTKTSAKETVRLAIEELQNTINEEHEKPAMDMLLQSQKIEKETAVKDGEDMISSGADLYSENRISSEDRIVSEDTFASEDQMYSEDRISSLDRTSSQDRISSQDKLSSLDRMYSLDGKSSLDDMIPKRKVTSKKERVSTKIPVIANLEVGDNKNSRILKLYEDGRSIVEISKILGMGQGEVKLVIDLFQGTRG